jgi:glycosyltransferase involved in cell wall biosynthesis
MRKVLIITYYWLPSGKATLHWPLGLVRYLPENDWEPVVLTVSNESFTEQDISLQAGLDPKLKVVRTPSFEPFNIYKKFTGKQKDSQLIPSELISKTNKSITHRLSIWIRMNLFIPDARVGWYPNAVSGGTRILKEQEIDAIISIGPPHSIHLAGLRLSRKSGIPHIPVFIDPWVDIVYYKGFKRSSLTLAADNYFEKRVLENAAAAVFVTKAMQEDYNNKYPFLQKKSHQLYWGYDETFFKRAITHVSEDDTEVILHTGNMFDYQNVPEFWKMVSERIKKGRKLRLRFTGSIGPAIRSALIENDLMDYTEIKGFLPYEDVIRELFASSFLLVCATEKRHVPGKLFEYLRAGKPVIAFGHDNQEISEILSDTNAGKLFNYAESGSYVLDHPEEFKCRMDIVKEFSRENITKGMAAILNSVKKVKAG